MRVVTQSYRIMDLQRNPMKHVEEIGRMCYKSEEKITEDSAPPFVLGLFKRRHLAMLEHYRFIAEVCDDVYNTLLIFDLKYFKFTNFDRNLISFNARALIEMCEKIDFKGIARRTGKNEDEVYNVAITIFNQLVNTIMVRYNCPELFGTAANYVDHSMVYDNIKIIDQNELTMNEMKYHGWMSVVFTTDRGVTHEMVRMRECSFAQESTRYCNYSNNKYDKQITVVDPLLPATSRARRLWLEACVRAECTYMDLLDMGVTAQDARSTLPTSVKADIVVTTTMDEWIHIFELRALGTTGKPHPMMEDLMRRLLADLVGADVLAHDGSHVFCGVNSVWAI